MGYTSPAIQSAGADLKVKVTGSLFSIIGITNIDGPNLESSPIEITHLQSDGAEYLTPKIQDFGDVSFTLQFSRANSVHKFLFDAARSGSNGLHFVYLDSAGTGLTFTGSLQSFSLSNSDPRQGIQSANVSIKLSGAIGEGTA